MTIGGARVARRPRSGISLGDSTRALEEGRDSDRGLFGPRPAFILDVLDKREVEATLVKQVRCVGHRRAGVADGALEPRETTIDPAVFGIVWLEWAVACRVFEPMNLKQRAAVNTTLGAIILPVQL